VAVALCFEGLSPVYDKLLFEYFLGLFKLMTLLLGFVTALAEVFTVLLEDFDSLLQNLVVLGGGSASSIELVHLIVVELDLTSEVLTSAFKGTHFIFKLVVLELDLG
jgi:hypothetical protein